MSRFGLSSLSLSLFSSLVPVGRKGIGGGDPGWFLLIGNKRQEEEEICVLLE
jgi:hypothetical protein